MKKLNGTKGSQSEVTIIMIDWSFGCSNVIVKTQHQLLCDWMACNLHICLVRKRVPFSLFEYDAAKQKIVALFWMALVVLERFV